MTSVEKLIFKFWDSIKSYYDKYTSNKYILVLVGFLIWMCFFDSDNFYRQITRRYQIVKLNKEIDYYTKELQNTKIEEKALTKSDDHFERFVREKYLLKKKNEDLFIFTEEPK